MEVVSGETQVAGLTAGSSAPAAAMDMEEKEWEETAHIQSNNNSTNPVDKRWVRLVAKLLARRCNAFTQPLFHVPNLILLLVL